MFCVTCGIIRGHNSPCGVLTTLSLADGVTGFRLC